MKVRRLMLLLPVLLSVSLSGGNVAALAQEPLATREPAATLLPDLSSPENTVRSFLAALSLGDLNTVVKSVAGAKPSAFSADMAAQHRKIPLGFVGTDYKVTETDENNASVSLIVTVTQPRGMGSESWPPKPDTVALRRDAQSRWQIVPTSAQTFSSSRNGYVSEFSAGLAHPDLAGRVRDQARAGASLANVKQLCTAVLMLAQDRNERFALTPATFRKNLLPYLARGNAESVFVSPLDAPGTTSYVFNVNLAGAPLKKIRRSTQTVLIYEGANNKLRFRYDGRAVVGFADGSAKLVTPAEAKTLRFAP